MKRIDLTPTFLQSDKLENPIIRTDQIQYIKFNYEIKSLKKIENFIIKFQLIDSNINFWIFDNMDDATKAYVKIKEQLKDVKMIV
jgi:hypothetical protein